MADIQGALGQITGNLFGNTFLIILGVLIVVIIIGLGVGIGWYFFFYRRKFDINVKIISRRSGEDKVYFDKGAILRDKKNNTDFLKLRNSKTELELPKFNVMYHTNQGDYIEILRESERGYRFLTPAKIDKTYLVRYNGKLYPIADIKQYQIENDLTWILERLKLNKKLINPENILMKLLEHAPQIMSMAFSFIILWVVFKYAPDMLAQLAQLAESVKKPQPVEVIGSIIALLWKKNL